MSIFYRKFWQGESWKGGILAACEEYSPFWNVGWARLYEPISDHLLFQCEPIIHLVKKMRPLCQSLFNLRVLCLFSKKDRQRLPIDGSRLLHIGFYHMVITSKKWQSLGQVTVISPSELLSFEVTVNSPSDKQMVEAIICDLIMILVVMVNTWLKPSLLSSMISW